MPTADATLLPPPLLSDEDERGSARRLDDVGIETVLEAMIEAKRRASQPSFAAIELPNHVLDDDDDDDGLQPPGGRSPVSEVFLKAR